MDIKKHSTAGIVKMSGTGLEGDEEKRSWTVVEGGQRVYELEKGLSRKQE